MVIIYSFPHPLGKPGIGTTALRQVESISKRGVEVLLYCTTLEDDVPAGVEVVETLRLAGRRIPHRALGVERAYRYHDLRVARGLRKHRDRVDVVHTWPKASIRTCTAARALGIPSLREVPNTHTAYAFAAVAREEQRLGLRAVAGHSHTFDAAALERERREYEVADVLLVPSEFARDTFLAEGVAADKLALHRFGFDERSFGRRGAGEVTSRPGLRALFVGSCEPRKGLHYALQAWIESGAAETGTFVICGGFVPGYREALAPWLDHPSIEILGFVDDPGTLMRDSDVFLFPSIEEGSALVTYEAQACGCVLAVSDAAGARVTHMQEGLVHPAGDLETLTSHIRLLHEDRDLLQELQRATLAHRDKLTWDAAAVELVSAYVTAAESARPD